MVLAEGDAKQRWQWYEEAAKEWAVPAPEKTH
jgi:hypothetical protein